MKRIHVSHHIGDMVFLKTDPEQSPRIIARMTIAQSGVEYGLRRGAEDFSWHQACEIDRQPKPKNRPGYHRP